MSHIYFRGRRMYGTCVIYECDMEWRTELRKQKIASIYRKRD